MHKDQGLLGEVPGSKILGVPSESVCLLKLLGLIGAGSTQWKAASEAAKD